MTGFIRYNRLSVHWLIERLPMRLSICCLLILACVLLPVTRAAAQDDTPINVTGITADAREIITEALAAYRRGEFQSAYKLARAAYLDYFENAEPTLRALNHDLTLDMELRFAELRAKMQLRRPPEEIEPVVANVRAGLIEIDAMFESSGARLAPLIAFSSSFLITLREGLEALLVIGVVLGALRASRSRGLGRYVLFGAGLAGLLSMLTWALLHSFLIAVPVAAQALSALASLLAVGMLVWVNQWVMRRLDQRYWLETMSAKAWATLSFGGASGLLVLGFSAFFRQGLETALLTEVLLGYSKRSESFVLLGGVAAVVVMIGAAVVIARGGRMISPQRFLRVCIGLLALLSVAFIGGAVWQLQEGAYLPVTSAIKVVPRLPYFIASLTGIHPTWESLGAQFGLIALYAVLFGVVWLRRPYRDPIPSLVRSAAG